MGEPQYTLNHLQYDLEMIKILQTTDEPVGIPIYDSQDEYKDTLILDNENIKQIITHLMTISILYKLFSSKEDLIEYIKNKFGTYNENEYNEMYKTALSHTRYRRHNTQTRDKNKEINTKNKQILKSIKIYMDKIISIQEQKRKEKIKKEKFEKRKKELIRIRKNRRENRNTNILGRPIYSRQINPFINNNNVAGSILIHANKNQYSRYSNYHRSLKNRQQNNYITHTYENNENNNNNITSINTPKLQKPFKTVPNSNEGMQTIRYNYHQHFEENYKGSVYELMGSKIDKILSLPHITTIDVDYNYEKPKKLKLIYGFAGSKLKRERKIEVDIEVGKKYIVKGVIYKKKFYLGDVPYRKNNVITTQILITDITYKKDKNGNIYPYSVIYHTIVDEDTEEIYKGEVTLNYLMLFYHDTAKNNNTSPLKFKEHGVKIDEKEYPEYKFLGHFVKYERNRIEFVQRRDLLGKKRHNTKHKNDMVFWNEIDLLANIFKIYKTQRLNRQNNKYDKAIMKHIYNKKKLIYRYLGTKTILKYGKTKQLDLINTLYEMAGEIHEYQIKHNIKENKLNTKKIETGLIGRLGKFSFNGNKIIYTFKEPSHDKKRKFNMNLNKAANGLTKKKTRNTTFSKAFFNAYTKKRGIGGIKISKKRHNKRQTKKGPQIYETNRLALLNNNLSNDPYYVKEQAPNGRATKKNKKQHVNNYRQYENDNVG